MKVFLHKIRVSFVVGDAALGVSKLPIPECENIYRRRRQRRLMFSHFGMTHFFRHTIGKLFYGPPGAAAPYGRGSEA
ncbi:MAG: hypothetical protein FWC55_09015 [Firmicutes bacterium]|nr:hypothetical protein [Bacillota bacterium]